MPSFDTLLQIFSPYFQEKFDSQHSLSHNVASSSCALKPETTLVEIILGKSLHISSDLDSCQQEQLVTLLRDHLDAFAWSYEDMKGIPPETFTHHIYI